MNTFHWTSKGTGAIFLTLSIPSLSGGLAGAMIDRVGPRRPAFIAFLVTAVDMFCLQFVQVDTLSNMIALCVLLTVLGFTTLIVHIIALTEIFNVVSEYEAENPGVFGNKGAMSQGYALMNVSMALGGMLGPIIGGLVQGYLGWSGMTLTCAVIFLVISVPVGIYIGPGSPKIDNGAAGEC